LISTLCDEIDIICLRSSSRIIRNHISMFLKGNSIFLNISCSSRIVNIATYLYLLPTHHEIFTAIQCNCCKTVISETWAFNVYSCSYGFWLNWYSRWLYYIQK
jgi:hypothetical protein